MTKILDSYALLAYLEREPGFEKVKSLFISAIEDNNNLIMSSVNFGEIYYIILREYGQKKVEEIEKIIQTLPITIIDVDVNLAREAARCKASKKISYTDCFAAALAKIYNGELITGDKEFKTVENEVKIAWIN